MPSDRRILLSALLPALLPLAAHAADEAPTTAIGRSFELGIESARLPEGERMGLLSAALLFEADEGWWLGPAVFGAASGHRGGLFVGGAQLERRWSLAPRWQGFASLFVGGGGGAAAPVGGGLMLQPQAGVWFDLAGGLRAGAAWSALRFPSGQVRGSGPSLLLSWDGSHRYADASFVGSPAPQSGDDGLGFSQAALSVGRYRLADGSGRDVGLVGARALARGDGALAWGLEAAAAASGGAAGYMELLGSLGASQQVLPGLEIGARAALGLGGGGDIATGGGVIGKLAATLSWRPTAHWQLGLEAGRWSALNGPAKATTTLWWAADLEAPRDAPATVAGYEWSARVQHVVHARRKDGSDPALDAFGGSVDLRAGDFGYWTAQAYSAFAGGAGAYSVGLLGAGINTPAHGERWVWGAELLAGAAGGGGVATGGGAIVQALAWTGVSFGGSARLRAGVGVVRSLRGNGGLDSPMIEIAWSQPFGLRGF